MKSITCIVIILLLGIAGCSPLSDYRQFTDRDIQPPIFISMGTSNQNTLEIQFSEEITADTRYIHIDPTVEISSVNPEKAGLIITFNENLSNGKLYKIEIAVSDISGNSLTIISEFYGYNPHLPELKINEFTTQGSATNPDKVELRILNDGNTAGICIYEGIDTNWEQRKILPPIDVIKDDYIIIHFKPEGLSEEVDETTIKNISGGLNAHPDAWDIWVDGGSGLSGNNGTITVFSNPRGDLLDGLLYSNRTSASDANYRGFGSTSVLNKAERLFELGGWSISGENITPEDAINPEDSTATRSVCRETLCIDTNSSLDWHIVPTSTSSFGLVNSNQVYVH